MRGSEWGVPLGLGAVRRIASALAPVLALAAILCAVSCASAQASNDQFAVEGEGAGQVHEPSGIAVNQESGDVYLVDSQNNRVEQFSSAGAFIRAWGWGVADGAAAPELCTSSCEGGLPGSGGGQLETQARGIAIDNSVGPSHGDVYVVDRQNLRIERYSPSGAFILTFGGEVNSHGGDVCKAGETCKAGVSGTGPKEFNALERNVIAVGPTGTVYVGGNEEVKKFSSGGVSEGVVPLAGVGVVEALAVDSSGEIYVLGSAGAGIAKFNGAGAQQGAVRDPGATGLGPAIAIGEGERLIVSNPETSHIDEYAPEGEELQSIAEPSEASGGIAYGQTLKRFYVLESEASTVAMIQSPPAGPIIAEGSELADQREPTSARLRATVNSESSTEAAEVHFEYGTSEAYGTSTPTTTLATGFEEQPAEASIAGLLPNTEYHFRAVASNAAHQSATGPDMTFRTPPAVLIESESTAEVTADSAKLIAQLELHGLASEYHFEYGLSPYEHSAPIPDAVIGAGSEGVSAKITVQGLQPGALYHYRVSARNALNAPGEFTVGSDHTFRTQEPASVSLPDGRAWEMVSPANKHGVSLEALTNEGGVIQAAADGSALTYIALGAIEEEAPSNRGGLVPQQLLARRGVAGVWSSEDIATRREGPSGFTPGNAAEYKMFSSDLARAAVEPIGAARLDPSNPANTERTPYVREASGEFTPLLTSANVPAKTKFGGKEAQAEQFEGGPSFVTGSEDLSHVLLNSPIALSAGFESEAIEQSVFEWAGGRIEAASVLPSGAQGASEGPSSVGIKSEGVRHAISQDGKFVFFETRSTVNGTHLYRRDMESKQTIELDAPQAGVKASPANRPVYQLASRDAGKVLFTDQARLTRDATARPGAPDLYECELEAGASACNLRDLSVDQNPNEPANVQGAVLGSDESGRYVYFVAKGALSPGATHGSCPGGEAGACVNLYEYDTQTQSRALVAVLSEADKPGWEAGGAVAANLGAVTARVSPNGRYLAFMSERPLTGYDNRDANNESEKDEEVFLFDRQAGTLRCASCDPSGQRPQGIFDTGVFPGLLVDRAKEWAGQRLAASIPGWTKVDLTHALYQSRYLSNEGRLFFNGASPLVPADTNGTEDVYEYEPDGVGNCVSPQGCIGLISSGESNEESTFLDASESGEDVFFMTAAQLSPSDNDHALDIYDAHVCALAPGCAPQAIGAPPPCASADACRSAPSPQPSIYQAPASATFSGAGNLISVQAAASVKAKAPTRAQLLAKALASCKKKKPKQRAKCRAEAKKRYGPPGKGAKRSASGRTRR